MLHRVALVACLIVVIATAEQKFAQKAHPMVLLPGFASGRLRTWRDAYCKAELAGLELGGSGAMFKVGDAVWLDTPMVVGQRACFLRCMKLVNGTDPEPGPDGMGACKVRADEGLDAISKLDPGIITGPLTDVWWTFIQTMAQELGLAPEDGMVAAPYDWRLDPVSLQERDNFFTKLRHLIEEQVLKRPGDVDCGLHPAECPGVVVVAHSMGNNVMRYFVEWLEVELGSLHYKKWLDRYIYLFVAVGAPWLGAAEGVRSMLSGNTFGLPVSNKEARDMGSTWGSGALMMPVAIPGENANGNSHMHLKFESPEGKKVFVAGDLSKGETSPFGTMRRLGDKVGSLYAETMERYKEDKAVDVFQAPKRLPLKRIVCAYGVNRATEAAHHYSWDNDAKVPVLEEVIYEQARSEHPVLDFQKDLPDDLAYKSGDGTVNYASLAWCKRWLGSVSNITLVPDGDALGSSKTVRCENCDVAEFAQKHQGRPSNTYYEADMTDEAGDHRFTQIWEFENVEHRDTIKSPPFLRELTALLSSARDDYAERAAAEHTAEIMGGLHSIDSRGGGQATPTTDKQCVWDYSHMECAHQEFCNYDYQFGDLTLSQSCRLRSSTPKVALTPEKELDECVCASTCVQGFCKYADNCKGTATLAFGPSNGFWGPCTDNVSKHTEDQPKAGEDDQSTKQLSVLKTALRACKEQQAQDQESGHKCTAAQLQVATKSSSGSTSGAVPAGSMCFDQTKLFVFAGFLFVTLGLALSPLSIFNADQR